MKIGDTLTVKIDPDSNGGFDQAPAIVVGLYSDSSARVRVLGASPELDTVRNYVGDDGEPYDADKAAQDAAATDVEPVDNPEPAAPTDPGTPGVIPPA